MGFPLKYEIMQVPPLGLLEVMARKDSYLSFAVLLAKDGDLPAGAHQRARHAAQMCDPRDSQGMSEVASPQMAAHSCWQAIIVEGVCLWVCFLLPLVFLARLEMWIASPDSFCSWPFRCC